MVKEILHIIIVISRGMNFIKMSTFKQKKLKYDNIFEIFSSKG